jgi:hypothetical protein
MGHAAYRTGAEPLNSDCRASKDAFARLRAAFKSDLTFGSLPGFPGQKSDEDEAAELPGREDCALLDMPTEEQRLGARLGDAVEGVSIAHRSFIPTP